MTTTQTRDLDTAAAVLGYAREQRRIADQAEANLLQAAVDWAAMHSTDSLDEAEMHVGYGHQGLRPQARSPDDARA